MKKIVLIGTCMILLMASTAFSNPPTPPQGAPPDNQYGPPGGDRREAWQNFARQNPQEAETIMRICKEHPELGCPFQQGPRPQNAGPHGMGPGGMGPGGMGLGGMGPGGMGPGGMGPGGMGPGGNRPGGMGPEDDELGMGRPQMNPEIMAKMNKLRDLKNQVRELGRKYNASQSADEKKKIETQIRGLLDEIYALKLELMRSRVKEVESKLNEVKAEMKRYELDRKGVTDSWFNQIAGDERYKQF